jgi:hypothetical protein
MARRTRSMGSGIAIAGLPGHGLRNSDVCPEDDNALARPHIIDEWFAGFAPAAAPEVAIVVLAAYAGRGVISEQQVAARIAAESLRALYGSLR